MLKPYLESADINWCWHNGKFDIKFLRVAGVRARVSDDTMLMSYALDENGGVHDLETVSCDVLGAPDYKYMIQPYLPNKQASYELVPPKILAAYQAIDTSNTAQIRSIYRERVQRDPALDKLYVDTLIPASEMLAQVEHNGICTDPERIDENEVYFADMKADIGAQINEMIGYSINAGSPKQVSHLLYRRMRLPNKRKGSTDEKALKWLQERTEHPIFALILKHRKAVKMAGTYVKGLRVHVDPITQRIHATFLIHGTRTGRLACRNPNLQNPPRGPQIRGTFVAAEGYELVEVDLSQAELRSLAALSDDPALCEVFLSGGSPHKDLSIYLSSVGSYEPDWEERYAKYSKDPENPLWLPAKEEYTKSKNVNFGIMYGITAFGLMGEINDTKEVAQEMLDGWSTRYHVAQEFIDKCRATPLKNQIITTCFGRKKRVGIVSRQNLNFLQNEAANFPHQSIASDITLTAAIRTEPTLRSWGVRIVNLIHDSILMEVPITPQNETRGRAIRLVGDAMTQVPIDYGITRVPFLTEAEVGHRWGSLMSVEEAA
jgi:DNA polymerase-1